jgi:hypothetical protein
LFSLWLCLCFLMPLSLSKLHRFFLLIRSFVHGFNKDVWSLMGQEHKVVTIFNAPNYCYRCGTSLDFQCNFYYWFFFSCLCMFSPCMKMYFSLPRFC